MDLSGNVWEWTSSPWTTDYSEQAGAKAGVHAVESADPADSSGARRVIRGGGSWSDAHDVRSAYRFWFDPVNEVGFLGFRVVLAAAPSER